MTKTAAALTGEILTDPTDYTSALTSALTGTDPGTGDTSIVPVNERTRKATLARYEGIVHKHAPAFLAVGAALAAIRDDKLYKSAKDADGKPYTSWEDYLSRRFDFDRSTGNQYVEAAKVQARLVALNPTLSVPSVSIGHTLFSVKDPETFAAIAPVVVGMTTKDARRYVKGATQTQPEPITDEPTDETDHDGTATDDMDPTVSAIDALTAEHLKTKRAALRWVSTLSDEERAIVVGFANLIVKYL